MYGLAPNYMCELIQPVSIVSTRNSLSNAKGDVYVLKLRTQISKNSIAVAGATLSAQHYEIVTIYTLYLKTC